MAKKVTNKDKRDIMAMLSLGLAGCRLSGRCWLDREEGALKAWYWDFK